MFAVTGVAGRTVAGVGCLQVDALRTSVTNAIRRGAIIHSFFVLFFKILFLFCVICHKTTHPRTHHFDDGQVERSEN